MKTIFLILTLALAGLVGTGCISRNSDKFRAQVQKWVPLGTSADKAQKIMEKKGFECSLIKQDSPFNKLGVDYLECEREQVWFHDWNARFIVRDDKVTDYGPAKVK